MKPKRQEILTGNNLDIGASIEGHYTTKIRKCIVPTTTFNHRYSEDNCVAHKLLFNMHMSVCNPDLTVGKLDMTGGKDTWWIRDYGLRLDIVFSSTIERLM